MAAPRRTNLNPESTINNLNESIEELLEICSSSKENKDFQTCYRPITGKIDSLKNALNDLEKSNLKQNEAEILSEDRITSDIRNCKWFFNKSAAAFNEKEIANIKRLLDKIEKLAIQFTQEAIKKVEVKEEKRPKKSISSAPHVAQSPQNNIDELYIVLYDQQENIEQMQLSIKIQQNINNIIKSSKDQNAATKIERITKYIDYCKELCDPNVFTRDHTKIIGLLDKIKESSILFVTENKPVEKKSTKIEAQAPTSSKQKKALGFWQKIADAVDPVIFPPIGALIGALIGFIVLGPLGALIGGLAGGAIGGGVGLLISNRAAKEKETKKILTQTTAATNEVSQLHEDKADTLNTYNVTATLASHAPNEVKKTQTPDELIEEVRKANEEAQKAVENLNSAPTNTLIRINGKDVTADDYLELKSKERDPSSGTPRMNH